MKDNTNLCASNIVAAASLGLPSPPAYLSMGNTTGNCSLFLNGVNFASGGAGVLDATNKVRLEIKLL
jgi:hypothetical protein